MSEIRTIGLPELRRLLEEGAVEHFWNVLTEQYFTGEMIPGSRWVPLDRVGREAGSIAADASIVVYCAGPWCPQSRIAAEKLSALGHARVAAFEGGLEEWKVAGLAVESAAAPVMG